MEPGFFSLLLKVISFAVANKDRLSRSVDDVVRDLKLIRFDDDGIVSLIGQLLKGEKPSKERAQELLLSFNDSEWSVQAAVERLSTEATEDVKRVSRFTREELQLIGWGKLNVRRGVQEQLNRYLQPRAKIDLAELRRTQEQIIELNRAIDEAEDALLHGRRH